MLNTVFRLFLLSPAQSDGHYKDILLALERSTNQSREIQEWWVVDQSASSLVPVVGRASLSGRREAGLQLFVFSDKVSPPSLGFLAGYGYSKFLQVLRNCMLEAQLLLNLHSMS